MSDSVGDWLTQFNELNPDAVEASAATKTKQYKLDLFKIVLPALDMRDIGFYDKCTAEDQRGIESWVTMRAMSSASGVAEHHLMMVNDIVNRDFSCLTPRKLDNKPGHPKLQWMLLALCGTGKSRIHPWINAPKGIKKNKLELAIIGLYPLFKDNDLELFLSLNSKAELVVLFTDHGYDSKSINEIFE